RRLGSLAIAAVVLLLAILLGSAATGMWSSVLLWLNHVPFGESDPQFGRDIAFFVFDLPAYRAVHGWLIGVLLASTAGAAAVYALGYTLHGFVLILTPGMRAHLSGLAGALLILIAAGTYLGI